MLNPKWNRRRYERLVRRKTWIEQRLNTRKVSLGSAEYDSAEVSALKWALEVIDSHFSRLEPTQGAASQ